MKLYDLLNVMSKNTLVTIGENDNIIFSDVVGLCPFRLCDRTVVSVARGGVCDIIIEIE